MRDRACCHEWQRVMQLLLAMMLMAAAATAPATEAGASSRGVFSAILLAAPPPPRPTRPSPVPLCPPMYACRYRAAASPHSRRRAAWAARVQPGDGQDCRRRTGEGASRGRCTGEGLVSSPRQLMCSLAVMQHCRAACTRRASPIWSRCHCPAGTSLHKQRAVTQTQPLTCCVLATRQQRLPRAVSRTSEGALRVHQQA